jgi:hypothetical protein
MRSDFDRRIDLRFHQANQLGLIPLGHRQHATDGAAFDHFLDVPSGIFVFVQEDVNLVDPTKKVMEIARRAGSSVS